LPGITPSLSDVPPSFRHKFGEEIKAAHVLTIEPPLPQEMTFTTCVVSDVDRAGAWGIETAAAGPLWAASA